uniref:Secreted protein n=1 Tax=Romanomermis culicivorax TaxID=13658 RepID=A0A915J3P8_ROMCU
MGGAGWGIGLACLRPWWMALTAGDHGSPSNRSLSTGVAQIVQLEMNSMARRATSGPNTRNTTGSLDCDLGKHQPGALIFDSNADRRRCWGQRCWNVGPDNLHCNVCSVHGKSTSEDVPLAGSC